MIAQALKYICKEITLFNHKLLVPPVEDLVELGNIARLDSSTDAKSGDLNKKVVLTLVNLEEEKTLRNSPHYVQKGDAIAKQNPTLYLNLYLLFSCADSDYEMALNRIDIVISALQSKYVFTEDVALSPFPDGVEKIILDLFSLNFEQINHLWGTLGGKYIPSVLYKARLIAIQASHPEDVAAVREIKTAENAN